MHGDQVDRGGGGGAGGAVQVGRAAEPGGELGHADVATAPEVAHAVSVAAVPFPPLRRETAQVVAVDLADVPRLGDQLRGRNHRVLGDQLEEGRHRVEVAPALVAG